MGSKLQSTQRIGSARSSAAELVCEFGCDTLLTFVNEAYCEFFGRTREELIGRSFLELVPVELHDKIRDHLADITAAPREIAYEHEVLLPDGSRAWQEWVDYPVLDENGAVASFRSVARDVTERRRVEQALRESEANWRSITENSPDHIMTVDRDGQILFINHTVPDLEKVDVIGTPIFDYVPEESRATIKACFGRVLATGKPDRYEVDYIGDDGRTQRFEAHVGPILQDGEIVGLGLTSRNITDRLEAEKARQRLELEVVRTQKLESLGLLAGGIAHDFNNILQVILGRAEFALTAQVDDRARDSLESIVKEAQRAAELCNQMLVYSGGAEPAFQRVDVGDVVVEMQDLLAASVSKKAGLELAIANALPAIQADPTQIQQIVLNLVINASEAIGDEAGRVGLRVEPCPGGPEVAADLEPGEYVLIEVEDSGCGMDPATAVRVFDPFFTTKFTGRGLGLAVVQGIVRGHGGVLDVTSDPGRGTRIRVWLPIAEADAEPVQWPRAEPAGTVERSGRILVVDDEKMVRESTTLMLESEGFEVLTAANGAEALAQFRRQPDDLRLVILDLTMPEMGGEEVLAEIKALRPQQPVDLVQ